MTVAPVEENRQEIPRSVGQLFFSLADDEHHPESVSQSQTGNVELLSI